MCFAIYLSIYISPFPLSVGGSISAYSTRPAWPYLPIHHLGVSNCIQVAPLLLCLCISYSFSSSLVFNRLSALSSGPPGLVVYQRRFHTSYYYWGLHNTLLFTPQSQISPCLSFPLSLLSLSLSLSSSPPFSLQFPLSLSLSLSPARSLSHYLLSPVLFGMLSPFDLGVYLPRTALSGLMGHPIHQILRGGGGNIEVLAYIYCNVLAIRHLSFYPSTFLTLSPSLFLALL